MLTDAGVLRGEASATARGVGGARCVCLRVLATLIGGLHLHHHHLLLLLELLLLKLLLTLLLLALKLHLHMLLLHLLLLHPLHLLLLPLLPPRHLFLQHLLLLPHLLLPHPLLPCCLLLPHLLLLELLLLKLLLLELPLLLLVKARRVGEDGGRNRTTAAGPLLGRLLAGRVSVARLLRALLIALLCSHEPRHKVGIVYVSTSAKDAAALGRLVHAAPVATDFATARGVRPGEDAASHTRRAVPLWYHRQKSLARRALA